MQTLLRCDWGGLVSSLLCCTSRLPEIAEEVTILVLSEKQTETLAKMTVREGPTPTVANPQTPNEGSGTVLALRPAGSPGNSGPGVSFIGNNVPLVWTLVVPSGAALPGLSLQASRGPLWGCCYF